MVNETKDDSYVYVIINTPSCQLPVTCVAGAGNRSAMVVVVAKTRKLSNQRKKMSCTNLLKIWYIKTHINYQSPP